MFARLILLISLLLFSTFSFADLTKSISGYLYNTTWEDENFNENRTVAAVSGSIEGDNLALRGQVSTSDLIVRRLTLEYSGTGLSTEHTATVGRFNRVESFFNNLLDAPSSTQMAVLPFGGYNYRMFNGSYVLLDGIGYTNKYKYNGGTLITTKVNYGNSVINSDKDVQLEAFKTYIPTIDVVSDPTFDISLKVERKGLQGYIARQHYKIHLEPKSSDPMTDAIVSTYKYTDYILYRAGIRKDYNNYFVSIEADKGETIVNSTHKTKSIYNKAMEYNVVLGTYIKDFMLYTGVSRGKNLTTDTSNTDNFIGVTYNYDPCIVVSLAKHQGKGRGWVKYGSSPEEYKWNTLVLSTTYKF
jgi:hypothetical protein